MNCRDGDFEESMRKSSAWLHLNMYRRDGVFDVNGTERETFKTQRSFCFLC